MSLEKAVWDEVLFHFAGEERNIDELFEYRRQKMGQNIAQTNNYGIGSYARKGSLMPDIGMIEVSIILLVALFAIGPERMPEVARFLVKTKRLLNKIRLDIKSLWDKVDVEGEDKDTNEKSHDKK